VGGGGHLQRRDIGLPVARGPPTRETEGSVPPHCKLKAHKKFTAQRWGKRKNLQRRRFKQLGMEKLGSANEILSLGGRGGIGREGEQIDPCKGGKSRFLSWLTSATNASGVAFQKRTWNGGGVFEPPERSVKPRKMKVGNRWKKVTRLHRKNAFPEVAHAAIMGNPLR